MKKIITILAMLLIAATAYNQTSRRPANSNHTANKNSREKTSVTHKSTKSDNQRQSRDAIAKTKTTNDRTYHYEKKNPVKKSTTQQTRTTVNTERNNRNHNTVVATTQTAKTTSSRETMRVTDNKVNRKRTGNVQVTNNRPRETYHVSKSQPAVSHYKEYSSPRTYRGQHAVVHHYYHKPEPKSYRARYYVYRKPVDFYIVWTPVMHRHYIRMYPMVKYWHYTNGYHISLVSAYDAEYYRGEVRTVYGRVSEVYYSPTTDEYFLYFGLYYPYQDFTVVIPGYLARRYNHRPERYFDQRHVAVTGLITTYNGEPEIVVKESFQVHLY